MTLTRTCLFCGNVSEMKIKFEEWEEYLDGALAQVAFPNLNASEREVIISGTCFQCQKSIFGGDDDE